MPVQVAFEGLHIAGSQSIPPGHPFCAASVPVHGRDVARARALLREARDGANEVLAAYGDPSEGAP